MSIFAKKLDTRGVLEPPPPPPRPSEVGSPRAAAMPPPKPRGGYGIGDAILLMRTLPFDDNVDLVVQVVRATLASLNVRVQDIIEDAGRKEQNIRDGIAGLHGKVADLERELETRCKEIASLEADLKETSSVKERLQLSENHVPSSAMSESVSASIPIDAPSHT